MYDWELLGRELDEIDDVRRVFDGPNLEVTDQMSDDYLRTIDLTTQPTYLTPEDEEKLKRSIDRLNDNYWRTARMLGKTPPLQAFNSVADQVSAINSGDPSRRHIIPLMAIYIA